jgi:hypothetical protein
MISIRFLADFLGFLEGSLGFKAGEEGAAPLQRIEPGDARPP